MGLHGYPPHPYMPHRGMHSMSTALLEAAMHAQQQQTMAAVAAAAAAGDMAAGSSDGEGPGHVEESAAYGRRGKMHMPLRLGLLCGGWLGRGGSGPPALLPR